MESDTRARRERKGCGKNVRGDAEMSVAKRKSATPIYFLIRSNPINYARVCGTVFAL